MKRTALYRHFDERGTLLYVGISLNHVARLAQHRDTSRWFDDIAEVKVEWFETREAALDAETKAIQAEFPLHNILKVKPVESAQEIVSAVEDTRKALVRRIVLLDPLYSIPRAAALLGVSSIVLKARIRAKSLGSVTIPAPKSGKPVEYITGWQILDWMESLQQ